MTVNRGRVRMTIGRGGRRMLIYWSRLRSRVSINWGRGWMDMNGSRR